MFCRKCGAEIRLNAKFCAKCGTPVKKPEAATSAAAEEKKSRPVIELGPVVETEPVKASVAPVEPEKETGKEEELIIKMPGMTESSSNGQFNEWFSEPGDL